jgi:hypothetical protein
MARPERHISITWVPQATVRQPTSYFEEHNGIHFTEGYDELDIFDGSEPLRVDGNQFVLRHYRGFPDNETAIYLLFEVSKKSQIAKVLEAIIKQLNLRSRDIAWRRF